MNYGNIITESFKIFWKVKTLWVFGVVAAIFGQSDYSFNVSYRESISFPIGETPPTDFTLPFQNSVFSDFFTSFYQNPIPYIVVGVLLSLVWWVISSIFGWLARGAMIGMVDEADQNGTTSLGTGWKVGVNQLFPLFMIALLLALPMLLILIPVAIWGIQFLYQMNDFLTNSSREQAMESFFTTFFSAFACIFPLVCIGGLMGWILSLINIMAARSCVVENLGIINSIKRGTRVMIKSIGYTILTWFLLIVIRSTFGFIAAMPALVLWIPIARAILHGNWSAGAAVSALILAVYFVIVALGLGGIFTSFNATLWTKLYKASVDNMEADALPSH